MVGDVQFRDRSRFLKPGKSCEADVCGIPHKVRGFEQLVTETVSFQFHVGLRAAPEIEPHGGYGNRKQDLKRLGRRIGQHATLFNEQQIRTRGVRERRRQVRICRLCAWIRWIIKQHSD